VKEPTVAEKKLNAKVAKPQPKLLKKKKKKPAAVRVNGESKNGVKTGGTLGKFFDATAAKKKEPPAPGTPLSKEEKKLEELKVAFPTMAEIYNLGTCNCPICIQMRRADKAAKKKKAEKSAGKADAYDCLGDLRAQIQKKRISSTRLWAVMDNDKSNSVTFQEFAFGCGFFGLSFPTNNDSKMKLTFKLLNDVGNSNGLITFREFKAMLFTYTKASTTMGGSVTVRKSIEKPKTPAAAGPAKSGGWGFW